MNKGNYQITDITHTHPVTGKVTPRFTVGGVTETGRSFENGLYDSIQDALDLGCPRKDGRPLYLHTESKRWIYLGVVA